MIHAVTLYTDWDGEPVVFGNALSQHLSRIWLRVARWRRAFERKYGILFELAKASEIPEMTGG